jgi:hypothetical protein
MEMALDLLQFAWQPRTTVQAAFIRSEDETWRAVFMHVSDERREEYKRAGEARGAAQAKAKKVTSKSQQDRRVACAADSLDIAV